MTIEMKKKITINCSKLIFEVLKIKMYFLIRNIFPQSMTKIICVRASHNR
jgi:hypothetical protein